MPSIAGGTLPFRELVSLYQNSASPSEKNVLDAIRSLERVLLSTFYTYLFIYLFDCKTNRFNSAFSLDQKFIKDQK